MVGGINMLMKILRVFMLIIIPTLCIFYAVWFMKHEPFEEVVRTGLAILVLAILIEGWVSLFKC